VPDADGDAPLELMPEDWERALCVVAHPDDMEYGASMAVAKWTSQGKEIAYVLATAGEAGIDSIAPERAGTTRELEERKSAAVVGVSSVTFLGHPDGTLEHGLPLRRDIAREIRRHRPEVIISITFRLTFGGGAANGGGGTLNQADHRNLGMALIDAARDAGNRWIFEELTAEGFEPWGGSRLIAFAGSPRPTHAVDVSGFLDEGIASLQAHKTYLDNLGDGGFDPGAFIAQQAKAGGKHLGVPHALTFEVFSL
jgi:LmbE family N-acetylglucosaminyl deacetylase